MRTSDVEFSSLICVIDAIVDMYTISPDIGMISLVDGEREDVLLDLDLVLGSGLQFGVIEEP
jgi:hypothetical protein